MKYAVVAHSGKQYKVSEGDVVVLDRIKDAKEGADFKFETVLLVVEDDKHHVGTPVVLGAVVSGKVVGNSKGEKIRVAKYKAKVRYRKVIGFRAQLTSIKIEKIAAK